MVLYDPVMDRETCWSEHRNLADPIPLTFNHDYHYDISENIVDETVLQGNTMLTWTP